MVTWTTQSMGNVRTHIGRVIAFIPAGVMVDIPDEFSHLPWERSRIGAVSRNDRYLIVVSEGVKYDERLYAPIKFTVEKAA